MILMLILTCEEKGAPIKYLDGRLTCFGLFDVVHSFSLFHTFFPQKTFDFTLLIGSEYDRDKVFFDL